MPSLADLAALHRQGLLGDEDQVRQETSDRWVRAGDLLAGGTGRRRGADRRWLWTVLLGALALVTALALIMAARQAAGR